MDFFRDVLPERLFFTFSKFIKPFNWKELKTSEF